MNTISRYHLYLLHHEKTSWFWTPRNVNTFGPKMFASPRFHCIIIHLRKVLKFVRPFMHSKWKWFKRQLLTLTWNEIMYGKKYVCLYECCSSIKFMYGFIPFYNPRPKMDDQEFLTHSSLWCQTCPVYFGNIFKYRAFFQKIFEGGMLIRNLPTFPLQIFYEFTTISKDIPTIISGTDDTESGLQQWMG